MAYLNRDSNTIIVDAILTKKGRELLSKGKNQFNITKFALSDDEVNYGLWNPNHPSGTDYYGIIIEGIPCIEANPDETKNMRYKLLSLNKEQTQVAKLTGMESTLTLESNSEYTITPASMPAGIDSTLGYTMVLHDSTFATITKIGEVPGGSGNQASNATITQNVSGYGIVTSVTSVAKAFKLTTKSKQTTGSTIITIIGNESGATHTITLTVNAITIGPDGGIITGTAIGTGTPNA